MSSPIIDPGGNALFNIASWSSAASFNSTANIFKTSGANELAVMVIAYDGTATPGSVTAFSIQAGVTILNFSLYFKEQGNSSTHYQTIEIWTCQLAAQFNVAAALTTTSLTLDQVIDDAVVTVFAVENLFNITTPFDPNVSIPNGATVTVSAPPPILTFSTTNADDLLLFISSQGSNPGGLGTPTGWTSIGGGTNGGGARYQNSNICIKSVSAPQSGATVQDNNTGGMSISWCAAVGAFTGDALSKPFSFGSVAG